MKGLNFLRGRRGIKTEPTTLGKTPRGQWVAESPETTAPTGRHDLFDVYGSWLGDPYERYGPLEVASGVPMKRKVAMMKDPILAMCIGYAGSMMLNARRVITCKDESKRLFFEAMFGMWEQEFILSANVGIALGCVGMLKKWSFMKPERISVDGADPWTGRAVPYIIKGFDILHPLSVTPRFDDKGRRFEGIETSDGPLDVFFSLWLTFRKELGFGSYYGAGRLDHCYKDWWMAEYGGDSYMLAMQKEADRVALVGYPPGTTGGVDNRQIAVDVGDQVRSGATAAFPTSVYETTNAMDGTKSLSGVKRWSLDFLEGSGSFQRFHEIDDHHSKRKCLGYFIPPQTILDVKQSALGGPTTADVLGDIAIELLLQDAADIDRHLNRYVFPAVARANFPPGSPEVRIETMGLDPDNRGEVQEIIKAMLSTSEDAKYFDMREAMKRQGFPLKTDEDVAKADKEAAKKEADAAKAEVTAAKKEEKQAPDVAPIEKKEPKAAAEDGSIGPRGDPLAPWPDGEPVSISAEDVARALMDWGRLAPEDARSLLFATPLGTQDDEALPLGGAGSGNWGHAGRKGQKGGSMPQSGAMSIAKGKTAQARQAAAKAVGDTKGVSGQGKARAAAYGELYARRGTEGAIALDGAGNVVWRTDGEASSVYIPDDEHAKLKDTILIHNHPAGWNYDESNPVHNGNSFSPEDVIAAVTLDLAEAVAITPAYVHRLFRPEGGWPNLSVVKAALASARGKVFEELNTAVQNGTVPIDDANARFAHDMAGIYTRMLDLKYERTAYGTG